MDVKERIDKLLNKVDKLNKDIDKIVDIQKELKNKVIELERKLDKNDKQKRKKFRK